MPREYNVNERIRARQVLVIGEDGVSLGALSLEDALEAARARNLDLVEVAGSSDPPVCRLLDYDHFRYEQSRREREFRKTQKGNLLSEVRLRPKIGQHDVDFKTRKIREFLGAGEKVRLNVRFRGREITHPERGALLLGRLAESLMDVAVIDTPPKMEGNSMSMILSPGKPKVSKDSRVKGKAPTEDAQA